MRWWLALGPLIVCGLAFLPHHKASLELLSSVQQHQIDQIQQWETRALSGRRPSGQQDGRAAGDARSGKTVRMIDAWENSALSSKADDGSEFQPDMTTMGAGGWVTHPGTHPSGTHARETHPVTQRSVGGKVDHPHPSGKAQNPVLGRDHPVWLSGRVKAASEKQASRVRTHLSMIRHDDGDHPLNSGADLRTTAKRTLPKAPAPMLHKASAPHTDKPSKSWNGGGASPDATKSGQLSQRALQLDAKAAHEEEQASGLVAYANEIAQKIVKEKALEEMKTWLAAQQRKQASNAHLYHKQSVATPKKPAVTRGRAKEKDGVLLKEELDKLRSTMQALQHRQSSLGDAGRSAVQTLKKEVDSIERIGASMQSHVHKAKLVVHAPDAAKEKPAVNKAKKPPLTPDEQFRAEYAEWRKHHVHEYVQAHELFSASDFCNSQQIAAHPTISQLVTMFGPQWQKTTTKNPQIASLAAVTACLAALGHAPPGPVTASQYPDAWKHGSLKGMEVNVKKCAAGDDQACVSISRDPAALAALRRLIPAPLRK